MQRSVFSLALFLTLSFSNSFAQLNIELVSQLTYPNELNDIWGYTDGSGNEYALVGTTNSTSIVDISNPANPVELFSVAGATSIWRDIKTWNQHAYVTNETGGGLLIIDLSNLPVSINSTDWTDGGFTKAHNIFIDENGYGYVVGSNAPGSSTVIIDLNSDPMDPIVVGSYNTYSHDVFVRGDTMWTAEIYQGRFAVVDVTNKSMPVVMATQATPAAFTHNIWLNDAGDVIFTTDEVSGSAIGAFDVSDITDITPLGSYQSVNSNNPAPHNTFVYGDFLVTSYYRDGVTVADISNPSNIVETGHYDTSPFSGSGFNGCWGVYPYLPSGLIIASDIEEGLFILDPTYEQASFIAGNVTDSITGDPLFDVAVSFSSVTANTDLSGNYGAGFAGSGTFDVSFSKPGYTTKTITGVSLSGGATTTLDVQLKQPIEVSVSGLVTAAGSGSPLEGIDILIANSQLSYFTQTNNLGEYFVPAVFEGNYGIEAVSWGYLPGQYNNVYVGTGSNVFDFSLETGYYDDFNFNSGWTVNGNASTGAWVRGIPIGTDNGGVFANPDLDAEGDFYDYCFMTGNGGGTAGTDDVDNGFTELTSPTLQLADYTDAYIRYSRWFHNGGGDGSPNDSLIVFISNGTETALVELVLDADPFESMWKENIFRVSDYITPDNNVTLIIKTSDFLPNGHVVEAGFDYFEVFDSIQTVAGCNPPINLESTVNSTSGVSISWLQVELADLYQAKGRRLGTTPYGSFTTVNTFKNVGGLQAATSYEWKVRARCSGGAITDFSVLDTFTTLSAPTKTLSDAEEFSSLYPNPSTDRIYINYTVEDNSRGFVTITDIAGAEVLRQRIQSSAGLNQLSLDISNLSIGLYFVNLRIGKRDITHKFTKQQEN